MTLEELKALESVANTMKAADYQLALAGSFPTSAGRPNSLAAPIIHKLAAKSRAALHEARLIVEANSTAGLAFPPTAAKLADLLAEAAPDWLSYLPKNEADAWKADARVIVEAVRLDTTPKTSEKPAKMEADALPKYPHLNTTKSADALRRIFNALAEKEFIAREDSTGADMLAGFLNAFDTDPSKEGGIAWSPKPGGRIIWQIKARSGAPSKAALCDFLRIFCGARSWEDWETLAEKIFQIKLDKNQRTRYFNSKTPSACFPKLSNICK